MSIPDPVSGVPRSAIGETVQYMLDSAPDVRKVVCDTEDGETYNIIPSD